MTPARILLAALASAIAAAAPAAASTASISGSTLVVTAAAGEVNDIDFPVDSRGSGPRDSAGITAGPGCRQLEPDHVVCDAFDKTQVSLGDGDDRYFDFPTARATVDAGAGDDAVNVGDQDDVLLGGEGRDTLNGSSENDQIDGGPGDDSILGEEGDDRLAGGSGRDTINGDGQTNRAFGNDSIEAADGEQDLVDCSFGSDRATADAQDVLTDCEATTVQGGRPPGPTPTPTPQPSPTPQPETAPPALRIALSVNAARIRRGTLLKSGVRGRLAVNRGATLTLRLKARLGDREVVIGTATESVPALGEFTYGLKVSSRYRARVRKRKRLLVKVTLTARDADGGTASASKIVTMRA